MKVIFSLPLSFFFGAFCALVLGVYVWDRAPRWLMALRNALRRGRMRRDAARCRRAVERFRNDNTGPKAA